MAVSVFLTQRIHFEWLKSGKRGGGFVCFIALFFYALVSQAQTLTVNDFYQIILPVNPESSPSSNTQAPVSSSQLLNRYLKQGAAKLLVRLTGSRQVLQDVAAKPILDHPRKWLRSYAFRPHKEEGVVVGQDLVLMFDRQRILQYFQQAGLVIWPYRQRPHLLVLGTYEVAGLTIPLDQVGLSSHLNLDYRPVAEALGLPIAVPEGQAEVEETTSKVVSSIIWHSLPEFEEKLPQLQALLQGRQQDGVILFQLKSLGDAGYQLTYELYDKKFQQLPEHTLHEIVLPKTIQSHTLDTLYEQMFSEVVEYFSEPYRAQASVLGEVVLVLRPNATQNRAWKASQLFQIEKTLTALKPTLHDVKLTELTAKEAQFEITYQGAFEEMIKLLEKQVPLYLIQADALTGSVQMQLDPIEKTVASPVSIEGTIEQQLKQEFEQALQKAE